MSIEKATEASAAEMLSTMEVRVRMFPCSGESAALRRSAGERESESTRGRNNRRCLYIGRCVKRATHPRCCSSACTARGCCSTPGYCSRCCQSWARWMTTPVTMEMHTHTHTEVAVIHSGQRGSTPHPTLRCSPSLKCASSSPTETGFSNRKYPDLVPCRVTVFFLAYGCLKSWIFA